MQERIYKRWHKKFVYQLRYHKTFENIEDQTNTYQSSIYGEKPYIKYR